MSNENTPALVTTEVTALTETVQELGAVLQASVTKNGSLQGSLMQIQTSAHQAATSAGAASTSATSASSSATAASGSQTSAASSASSASTSATNASNSASTASTKATAASGSSSAASTSAGSASTSASNAAGYAARAANFKQVAPAHGYNWFSGAAAGTTVATASFTAPANGYVFAIGILNCSSQSTTSSTTGTLQVNGNTVAAAESSSLNQRHEGTLYVTTGTVVTITFSAYCPAATGEAASIYAFGFFVPAAN